MSKSNQVVVLSSSKSLLTARHMRVLVLLAFDCFRSTTNYGQRTPSVQFILDIQMDSNMDAVDQRSTTNCHVLAVPYPGRGHVNPMMNLCKLLSSKKHDILFTFVVTEEWLGFLGSDTKPSNIRFASIPNVIPSEHVRGADFPGFFEAVMTKMEGPFERLLDQLDPPVTTIIADAALLWAITIANKRNIPVATLCTLSATAFSILYHFAHIKDLQKLANLLGTISVIS